MDKRTIIVVKFTLLCAAQAAMAAAPNIRVLAAASFVTGVCSSLARTPQSGSLQRSVRLPCGSHAAWLIPRPTDFLRCSACDYDVSMFAAMNRSIRSASLRRAATDMSRPGCNERAKSSHRCKTVSTLSTMKLESLNMVSSRHLVLSARPKRAAHRQPLRAGLLQVTQPSAKFTPGDGGAHFGDR